MSQLETHAGQAEYYSAIRNRLRGTPKRVVRERKPEPKPEPRLPRDVLQVASQLPAIVAPEPERIAGPQSWRKILLEVAQKHGVPPRDILSQYRTKHLVTARYECVYRVREELKYSFPRIARLLHRDHTSVLHGYHQHRAKLEQ